MGDSPVTAICSVGRRVWIGFQIGYILIFDSISHHLVLQAWIKQYTPIVSVLHIPELKKVYIALDTGSVLAYCDGVLGGGPAGKGRLCPVSEYHALGQMASCATAIPNGTSHELWVGQSEARITVLNPSDLTVLKFIHNTSDVSLTPSYMATLTYANLVYSFNDRKTASQVRRRGRDSHWYCMSLYHPFRLLQLSLPVHKRS